MVFDFVHDENNTWKLITMLDLYSYPIHFSYYSTSKYKKLCPGVISFILFIVMIIYIVIESTSIYNPYLINYQYYDPIPELVNLSSYMDERNITVDEEFGLKPFDYIYMRLEGLERVKQGYFILRATWYKSNKRNVIEEKPMAIASCPYEEKLRGRETFCVLQDMELYGMPFYPNSSWVDVKLQFCNTEANLDELTSKSQRLITKMGFNHTQHNCQNRNKSELQRVISGVTLNVNYRCIQEDFHSSDSQFKTYLEETYFQMNTLYQQYTTFSFSIEELHSYDKMQLLFFSSEPCHLQVSAVHD